MYRKKAVLILAFLCLMLALGTGGYMLLERWSFLDALYMTIITITTIGFREVHELSQAGKVFTLVFSLVDFIFLAGSISIISSAIVEGQILGIYRSRRMQKKIQRLKKHIIVCGASKIGRHAIRELVAAHHQVVVVDNEERSPLSIPEASGVNDKDIFVMRGDATREDVLQRAGVGSAAGVVTCLPGDAQNLFIALTVKNLNPKLKIVSYVRDEANISKFYLVGVHEVVSSDFIIGRKLAMSMGDEHLLSFIDQVNYLEGENPLYLCDAHIKSGSPLIGHTLQEAALPRHTGLLVIAIKRPDADEYLFNPTSDTRLQAGDILIFMGSRENEERLRVFLKRTTLSG